MRVVLVWQRILAFLIRCVWVKFHKAKQLFVNRLPALFAHHTRAKRYAYNWEADWARFKSPIKKLVGWHRTGCCHIMLKTGAAYRVVYFKLLHEFLGEAED